MRIHFTFVGCCGCHFIGDWNLDSTRYWGNFNSNCKWHKEYMTLKESIYAAPSRFTFTGMASISFISPFCLVQGWQISSSIFQPIEVEVGLNCQLCTKNLMCNAHNPNLKFMSQAIFCIRNKWVKTTQLAMGTKSFIFTVSIFHILNWPVWKFPRKFRKA